MRDEAKRQSKALHNIPVNVITGFLGVGKTTAITQLLKRKPAGERWAVLVNEFGEVGIDGSLLQGEFAEQGGIYVREVPGGCMCCAAGLPMQIALNALLTRARPQRLLIEPTGLGHPEEVLAVLAGEHYQEVLDLRATLTLVDARKLTDSRYTNNTTFNQQLAVADVVVANKADLYQDGDLTRLARYLDELEPKASRPILRAAFGEFDWQCLNGSSRLVQHLNTHNHHAPRSKSPPIEPEMPASGYLRIDNHGAGFVSSGWIFAPHKVFEPAKLFNLLSGLDVERLKGVFITQEGVVACNMTEGVLTSRFLDDAADSRVELITRDAVPTDLEAQLLACLV